MNEVRSLRDCGNSHEQYSIVPKCLPMAVHEEDKQQRSSIKPQFTSSTRNANCYIGLKPAKKRKRDVDTTGLSTSDAITDTVQQQVDGIFVEDPQSQSSESLVRKKASHSTISTLQLNDVASDTGLRYAFGPAPKPGRNGKKGLYSKQEIVETRTMLYTSDWYARISTRKEPPRGHVIALAYIKNLIQKCTIAVRNDENADSAFLALRTRLHEMEFFPWLTSESGPTIKRSGVLEKGGLLSIIEDREDVFPWDIQADALALCMRWMRGDLDGHLLRGIDTVKSVLSSGLKRTSHQIQKNYPGRISANIVGGNGLVNGQWWPNRICALRDGAHGEQEAGIHGQTGHGAYSVVVASGGYSDEDHGAAIEYCGTASKTRTPTRNTALLLETLQLKRPLRVLRAENKASKYAPSRGIRYDGLYDVVEKELLDEATAMYRFSLRRQKNQDPIRYEGVEARPSQQEIQEMQKIREYLGMTTV